MPQKRSLLTKSRCVPFCAELSVYAANNAVLKARFSIDLDPAKLHLVYLRKRHLIEDSAWKRFTLIGQSLGSVVLAYEAMSSIIPDIFIGMLYMSKC